MQFHYWDVSEMAPGLVGVSGGLLAAEFTFAMALLPAVGEHSVLDRRGTLRLYFSVVAAIACLFCPVIMWVAVAASSNEDLKSVMAVLPASLTVLGAGVMIQSIAVKIDLVRPKDSEVLRLLMLGLIYLQRLILCLGGIGLAFIISQARNDVQPNRPLWHLVARIVLFLGFLPLARGGEMALRYRAESHPGGVCDRLYGRLRGARILPMIYLLAVSVAACLYFGSLWAFAGQNPDRLGAMFGRSQGRIVEIVVGIGFGLLELGYSADTMATLHRRRPGLVPTRAPKPPRPRPHPQRPRGDLGSVA